ncbi:MAG: 2Fe-2S iron-sulfur cluster binding domain-containing protein [Proteobacteria bacterium]|nr:2Fe-2S iron-sulfur cluster binding domain-containing protein [Pseudomonadota bacterium]
MGAQLTYKGKAYALFENESVLDCLLREHVPVPHSCCAGACQSCMMQAVDGSVIPGKAQEGLKASLTSQGFFLACQCVPSQDMWVRDPDAAGFETTVSVTEKRFLNAHVIALSLTPVRPFAARPGQYLTLMTPQNLARSYSIASDPERDSVITLHVKLFPDGAMGGWLRSASLGDEMRVRGPYGSCFYTQEEDTTFPLVLAGTGTGLAPLYGVLKDALAKGHEGPIHLFHGSLKAQDLYLEEELRALDGQHANFTYIPCVLHTDGASNAYTQGDFKEIVLMGLPQDKARARLFLCGAPDMVNALKTKAFLAGLSSKHIFVDAFLPSRSAPEEAQQAAS